MSTDTNAQSKILDLFGKLIDRIDALESTGSKEKETKQESERPSPFSKEYNLNHDEIKAWANKKVIV